MLTQAQFPVTLECTDSDGATSATFLRAEMWQDSLRFALVNGACEVSAPIQSVLTLSDARDLHRFLSFALEVTDRPSVYVKETR